MKLILASASPRRAEILRNAGFTFEVCAVHADESRRPNEQVEDYVSRLATTKADRAALHLTRNGQSAIVIGADTVVFAKGQILGKPTDGDDARRMLKILSGKEHLVYTGLSVLNMSAGTRVIHVEKTGVHFLTLSPRTIDHYIATGEPFDKAGAYGIQGIGGRFISRIEGCYFNVMGLPLSQTWTAIRSLGWKEGK
jgi:septum formation protein